MNSRKYYNNSGPHKMPDVKTGTIICRAGTGEILINQPAEYYADMGTYAYSSMVCTIETAKGDDAVEKGYAIITDRSKNSVTATFTRCGIYEMWIRFYNTQHQLVGEFTYEPIVVE